MNKVKKGKEDVNGLCHKMSLDADHVGYSYLE